jgi:hypothetical protein
VDLKAGGVALVTFGKATGTAGGAIYPPSQISLHDDALSRARGDNFAPGEREGPVGGAFRPMASTGADGVCCDIDARKT